MIEIRVTMPCGRQLTQILRTRGVYIIGRSLAADIRLRHESVAKKHACLRIEPDGVFLLDLGGASPVRRNGVAIANSAPVLRGDKFSIGECELAILAVGVSQREEAVASERTDTLDRATSDTLRSESPAAAVDELQPLKIQVQELVLRELDLFRRTALNDLNGVDLRRETRAALETIIATEQIELPAHIDRDAFVRDMTAEIVGYGPIEPFLADDTVSEIMVNGPEQIYIERAGRLLRVPARFTNAESLMRVIERIVTPLGRRIDEGSPMVDGRLPDGSRINAIIPPLSLVGPILTIRKFSRQRFSMQRLVDCGTLTANMAAFLKLCVEQRKNIIVSGVPARVRRRS